MRNLIANVYCARTKDTKVCALFDTFLNDENSPKGNIVSAIESCMNCNYCVVDFAGAGKSLAERGLPRLRNGSSLAAFQDDD